MDIQLTTHENLDSFLQIILPELGLVPSKTGKKLELIQHFNLLKIENSSQKTTIYYQEKAHLFRGLTLWLARNEEEFTYEEIPNFEKIGPMLDLSRNAVMTVPRLKRFITLCSKMGLNTVMMYMEDTYEIPEYPYFGHYRGRYSQEELKELDSYADQLGIELVPAIQTLAHLTNPLKWGFANGMRDTSDILLVDEEKTYLFLQAAIKSIAECFKTKKIHIGMDEAHDLGKGHYLAKHGLEDSFSIMTKHLQKVTAICENYQLKPMMWSDMFFRIGSKSGDYYDKNISFPKSLIDNMPAIDMVCWDYYHHEEEEYTTIFSNHKKLERPLIFAGGVWTWNGLAPNYGKSFATTKAGLAAAKKAQIKEVYATLWGDDGAETPLIASLLGLQQFSEEQFKENPSETLIAERFQLFHHLNAEDFWLLNDFDQTEGVAENNPHGSNSSKLLLYQDVFFGLYEKNLSNLHLKKHFEKLATDLLTVRLTSETQEMFAFYQQLARVLFIKADIETELLQAYQEDNHEKLKHLLSQLESLQKEIKKLQIFHRNLWFYWNKPFGYEVIDLRYGGLISRIETARWRLQNYLDGRLEKLTELEEPRLLFDSPFETQGSVGRNLFHGIYSASKISDV